MKKEKSQVVIVNWKWLWISAITNLGRFKIVARCPAFFCFTAGSAYLAGEAMILLEHIKESVLEARGDKLLREDKQLIDWITDLENLKKRVEQVGSLVQGEEIQFFRSGSVIYDDKTAPISLRAIVDNVLENLGLNQGGRNESDFN